MSERTPVTLVTGAAGEIGTSLLERLERIGGQEVVTVDLQPLPGDTRRAGHREHFAGDILDEDLWRAFSGRYRPVAIFHLAAVLSTRVEEAPLLGQRVNVDGTARLLDLAEKAARPGRPVRFIFPSSIAVYGFPTAAAKEAAPPVREEEQLAPFTLYGAQKLYIERLGVALERRGRGLDFRSVRLPGLISCETLPQGGTSDWAPELIHAAAQGATYACFVRREARLPFCAMPDAVDGIWRLAAAAKGRLTRNSYNLGGHPYSASEVIARVRQDFADARVVDRLDRTRDRIVASWPAAVDDRRARRDFGHAPVHDRETLFSRYLIPGIRRRYAR